MTGRLRVGMNLLWLVPGVVGGTEVAAVSMIDALRRTAPADIDLFLYAQTAFGSTYPDHTGALPTRLIGVPGGSRAARVALESSWLPAATRRDRIDVVHSYGGVVPPGTGRRGVLTLHDVQPLEAGSAFDATKRRWLARRIPASIERASAVAVPSQFVRDRVTALLDVDPEKLIVVPHGLDRDLLDRTDRSADAAVVSGRFGLHGPFILYPTITYAHKNHETLLRAFALLVSRRSDVTLVLAGGAGPAESAVARSIERLGVGRRVRRVGRVSSPERRALLRAAAVVAVPSRYEGFGLPALESIGVDTPVVASTAGSLPEVVGDAGRLIDPDDVDGWADAMAAVVDGADSDSEASRRRSLQAAKFDWDAAARRTVALYRHAAGTAAGTETVS